jgi:HEAT repeat protein
METVQQGTSVQDALWNTAKADPDQFTVIFGRMRKMFPDEVTEACLCYIAQKGLDPAGQSMAFWLSLNTRYLKVLFDPNALPFELAFKALTVLKKADAQLIVKFIKAGEQLAPPLWLLRALSLVPALGEYTALFPWLRKLSQQGDERIKSRAVKLLCELRPNSGQIARQLQDDDPRVRANAIEALWHANIADAASLFRVAVSDTNHRVVGNALVGLHWQGDSSAFDRIIELSKSPDPYFRSAMAWCLGTIRDERGVAALHLLSKDPSVFVRKRALRSLLAMQPEEGSASEDKAKGQGEPEKTPIPAEIKSVTENRQGSAPTFASLS